jgi:hypothetical protein
MFGKARKLLALGKILTRNPAEFSDRVRAVVETRWERIVTRPLPLESRAWDDVIPALGRELGTLLTDFSNSRGMAEIENWVNGRLGTLPPDPPFSLLHNADRSLARLCYMACRALNPDAVVETGVAYGVTSAYLLKAMEENGNGSLHSIDLPPLSRHADTYIGFVVPEALRGRWTLHRGASRRLLPGICSDLKRVGLFVHDSLHTRRNMLTELGIVSRHLTGRALVILDDVDDNNAFHDWVREARPSYSAIIQEQEKNACFGVGVMADANPARS